ncbi:hypothetical protein GWI33_006147 [Rhynchophorus ferrugineus]|uniref:Uncharacterized protein n=1 Tax=Rhynchophorus ferrugineus TaxID=354439 RepID=A0A834MD98_RHYFE|nr:hypothetical protein GWI33_006147 [Rhynchophorus ferrugineus]
MSTEDSERREIQTKPRQAIKFCFWSENTSETFKIIKRVLPESNLSWGGSCRVSKKCKEGKKPTTETSTNLSALVPL